MRLFGCHLLKKLPEPYIKGVLHIVLTLILSCSSAYANFTYAERNSLSPGEGKFNQLRGIEKAYQIKTVVIDAGHGGYDPGCLGSDSKEKEITLAIAQRLAGLLRSNYPELTVVMTRDDDTFVPLHERAALANRLQADLFISIHCNTMPPGPRAAGIYGTETYVMGLHTADHNLQVAKRENASILLENDYQQHYDYDPDSPEGHILFSMYQNAFLDQSIRLAEAVEKSFGGSGRKSRGVKQAGFVVLKSTAMPSILIETGFLSNSSEQQFLRQATGQQQIAGAIFDAFSRFKGDGEPVLSETEARVIPVTQPIISNQKVTEPRGNLWFRVQLAASRQQLGINYFSPVSTQFAIELSQEDGYYKYRTGNYTTLAEAERARSTLRNSGFPDAFIVAFRDGQKISLEEAQKLSRE